MSIFRILSISVQHFWGERVRALKLLSSVTAGMLLMWDRGKHSYAMVEGTVSQGCEYRVSASQRLLTSGLRGIIMGK
jgi:hypothetical protein